MVSDMADLSKAFLFLGVLLGISLLVSATEETNVEGTAVSDKGCGPRHKYCIKPPPEATNEDLDHKSVTVDGRGGYNIPKPKPKPRPRKPPMQEEEAVGLGGRPPQSEEEAVADLVGRGGSKKPKPKTKPRKPPTLEEEAPEQEEEAVDLFGRGGSKKPKQKPRKPPTQEELNGRVG